MFCLNITPLLLALEKYFYQGMHSLLILKFIDLDRFCVLFFTLWLHFTGVRICMCMCY